MSSATDRRRFRNDLQGLRAVAVLAVVLCHARVPGFAGGFVGVDVFFVLSGYLITRLLVRDLERTGALGYLSFIARRLRRLLPALVTMVGVSLLLATLALSPTDADRQTASAVSAITWTSNFHFAFHDFDYFDALANRDLFLHSWSLAVEEQYYLVWPWIIVLASSVGVAWSRRGALLAWLGATAVLSFGLSQLWITSQPDLAFYMMPARAWQFALGALAFAALEADAKEQTLPRVMAEGCGVAGLLLLGGSVVFLDDTVRYPGWRALGPSFAAFGLIVAGLRQPASSVSAGLSHPVLVWLGDRSYSIYLWHWPLLALLATPGAAGYWVALAVGLTLALAAVSFRIIENPFRYGRFSHARPGPTVVSSVAIMFVAAIVVFPLRAGFDERDRVAEDYNPRIDGPAIYGPGSPCDTGQFSDEVVPCASGPPDAPGTVVLLGDSIGAQWLSALPEMFPPPAWQVIVLTKSACPIVDVDYVYERIGRVYDVCARWRSGVVDHLETLRPDLLFIGSSVSYPFSAADWTEGSTRLFDRFSASAARTVVIAGTPQLGFDGPTCLGQSESALGQWLGTAAARCSSDASDGSAADVAGFLRAAAAGFDRVDVVDWGGVVCPAGRCSAAIDDLVVFRDDKHVTDRFVRAHVDKLRESLTDLRILPGDASVGKGL